MKDGDNDFSSLVEEMNKILYGRYAIESKAKEIVEIIRKAALNKDFAIQMVQGVYVGKVTNKGVGVDLVNKMKITDINRIDDSTDKANQLNIVGSSDKYKFKPPLILFPNDKGNKILPQQNNETKNENQDFIRNETSGSRSAIFQNRGNGKNDFDEVDDHTSNQDITFQKKQYENYLNNKAKFIKRTEQNSLSYEGPKTINKITDPYIMNNQDQDEDRTIINHKIRQNINTGNTIPRNNIVNNLYSKLNHKPALSYQSNEIKNANVSNYYIKNTSSIKMNINPQNLDNINNKFGSGGTLQDLSYSDKSSISGYNDKTNKLFGYNKQNQPIQLDNKIDSIFGKMQTNFSNSQTINNKPFSNSNPNILNNKNIMSNNLNSNISNNNMAKLIKSTNNRNLGYEFNLKQPK